MVSAEVRRSLSLDGIRVTCHTQAEITGARRCTDRVQASSWQIYNKWQSPRSTPRLTPSSCQSLTRSRQPLRLNLSSALPTPSTSAAARLSIWWSGLRIKPLAWSDGRSGALMFGEQRSRPRLYGELAEDGTLALDARVATCRPECARNREGRITVLQLLSHRASARRASALGAADSSAVLWRCALLSAARSVTRPSSSVIVRGDRLLDQLPIERAIDDQRPTPVARDHHVGPPGPDRSRPSRSGRRRRRRTGPAGGQARPRACRAPRSSCPVSGREGRVWATRRRESVSARWPRERGRAGGKHLPQTTAHDRAKSESAFPGIARLIVCGNG